MDVTDWMEWFFGCLKDAIEAARGALAGVVAKKRLWESIESMGLNERQKSVLHRFMNAFEAKLTSSKWAKLVKCSQDTATRDIQDLVAKGVLQRNEEGGRSTSYSLIDPSQLAH
jgi:Fic family protein